jgi:hypothetical protein
MAGNYDDVESDAERPLKRKNLTPSTAIRAGTLIQNLEGSGFNASSSSSMQKLSSLDPFPALLSSFESANNANVQLRAKFYPMQPLKFFESEVALHAAILALTVLSTTSEYRERNMKILVDSGSLESLLGLLKHGNTDIIRATLQVLISMTAASSFSATRPEPEFDRQQRDQQQALLYLGSHLVQGNIIDLLYAIVISAAPSLDKTLRNTPLVPSETPEAHSQLTIPCLELLSNVVSLSSSSALYLSTEWMEWLSKACNVHSRSVAAEGHVTISVLASDILATVMTSDISTLSISNKKYKDKHYIVCIEPLLMTLAAFRQKGFPVLNSTHSEEFYNIFENVKYCIQMILQLNDLPNVLHVFPTKNAFHALEGMELLLLCLKPTVSITVTAAALSLLTSAVHNSSVLSSELILKGGLKYVFSYFMGKGLTSNRSDQPSQVLQPSISKPLSRAARNRCIEHSLSIVHSLLLHSMFPWFGATTAAAEHAIQTYRLRRWSIWRHR